jgi:hypothetical protein
VRRAVDANFLVTIGLIGFGAYLVLFNRSFSQTAIRQQKAVWKIDSSRYEKQIRTTAAVVGIVLLSVGLWGGAKLLFP